MRGFRADTKLSSDLHSGIRPRNGVQPSQAQKPPAQGTHPDEAAFCEAEFSWGVASL